MKKTIRRRQNDHHPGIRFDYEPFNHATFPIPTELEHHGSTLLPQWNFLESTGYLPHHILFLVILYAYDCTCIMTEFARMAKAAKDLHDTGEFQELDMVAHSIASSKTGRTLLRHKNSRIYCLMYFQNLRRQMPPEDLVHSLIFEIWNIEKDISKPIQAIDILIMNHLTTMKFPCTQCSFLCFESCQFCPAFNSPLGIGVRRTCITCNRCNFCQQP